MAPGPQEQKKSMSEEDKKALLQKYNLESLDNPEQVTQVVREKMANIKTQLDDLKKTPENDEKKKKETELDQQLQDLNALSSVIASEIQKRQAAENAKPSKPEPNNKKEEKPKPGDTWAVTATDGMSPWVKAMLELAGEVADFAEKHKDAAKPYHDKIKAGFKQLGEQFAQFFKKDKNKAEQQPEQPEQSAESANAQPEEASTAPSPQQQAAAPDQYSLTPLASASPPPAPSANSPAFNQYAQAAQPSTPPQPGDQPRVGEEEQEPPPNSYSS